MRTIILTFSFLAVSLVASAEDRTLKRLLRTVHAELPKGWTVSFDKDDAWLEISRDEPVLSVSTLANRPPDEKPQRRTFTFAFRVVPSVDPADYRRLSAENAQIRQKAAALSEELIRRGVSHKFDSFFPSSNEEKEAVAQYDALKKSLHTLPDFYFDTISLKWGVNSPDHPIVSVTDDRIRDECARVQEKITKLFSTYDGA